MSTVVRIITGAYRQYLKIDNFSLGERRNITPHTCKSLVRTNTEETAAPAQHEGGINRKRHSHEVAHLLNLYAEMGEGDRKLPPCHNSLTTALLMDTYQITMAYAYWKNGTHDRSAAFDLLFRKNPFNGEFTVFAGLEECLRFISNFKFHDADIEYIKK